MLVYTDGLIERSGEDLDRVARLRQHAAFLTREPLAVFCDEFLAGLARGGADGIALLAGRLPPRDLKFAPEERPWRRVRTGPDDLGGA